MAHLVGIVLAAGRSERMGEPKQLLPYAGTTLLGRVVAEAEASSLESIVVVLGSAADAVQAALRPGRARIVRNDDFEQGNLSSLRVGVAAAGPHDAVMHLLGDMPEVDTAVIDSVAAAWSADRRRLAVTKYRDGVAHPLVLARSVTDHLGELEEPKSIWRLIETSAPSDVLEVPVDRAVPIDVDTRADYRRLLTDPGGR